MEFVKVYQQAWTTVLNFHSYKYSNNNKYLVLSFMQKNSSSSWLIDWIYFK